MHERPRALYCCVGHQRRTAAQKASATMKLRRIHAKIDRKVKEQARTRQHWREVVMGRDVQLHIEAIFGGKQRSRKSRSSRRPTESFPT
jgi:hypothetical protein